MKLGDMIKGYREEHGISQRQFALSCGLSNGYIAMIERGENPKTKRPIEPTLNNLKKIASCMGITAAELMESVDNMTVKMEEGDDVFDQSYPPIDFSKYHQIPILGRIAAGLPLYADEHVEGYTLTDLNGGAEYFSLRVKGDSMNAIGINDGYLIIVRRQDEVENGEVAVVLVGEEDATVKRFYATDTTVTLMPQSTNPIHQPQMYDLKKTSVKVLGKVVKVEFSL